MLTLVAQITLQDVIDAFLRMQTKRLGQSKMAEKIGTQRQGVNAILNRREGRRFTFEHLDRFAANTGIMTSTLLRELAKLAWEKESELIPNESASAAYALPAPAGEERQHATMDELADLLRELLEERRRRL